MSYEFVGLVMDIVVLAFLGATILYVLRLTKTLNEFKAQRREFDSVITNLLSGIDQAERSIGKLKQVSATEAGALEELILQSKVMAEELRIINDAGESMAKRLENLAEKNRIMAQSVQATQSLAGSSSKVGRKQYVDNKISSTVQDRAKRDYTSTLKNAEASEQDLDLPSFMIHDRDLESQGSSENFQDTSASSDAWDDDSGVMPENLQSQAERELLSALRTSKRKISRGERS